MAEYIERESAVHLLMNRGRYLTKNLVMDAAYEVSKIPAADVAPVVHGRWMEVPYVYIGLKRYECSNCYSDVFWNYRIQHHKDKYCPNCGARMDGE